MDLLNKKNYTKSRHTSSVGSKNWFIKYCRLYIFLYPRSKGCNFSNLRPHLTYTVQYCTSCALTGRILLRHACQLASVRGAHDLLDSRYVKADVSCPSTAQLAAVALPGYRLTTTTTPCSISSSVDPLSPIVVFPLYFVDQNNWGQGRGGYLHCSLCGYNTVLPYGGKGGEDRRTFLSVFFIDKGIFKD